MENLRRQFAQQPYLAQTGARPSGSVISVNSEDSSAPVRMSGHRRPANVVEISDSDSEGEASAPRPLEPRNNAQPPARPAGVVQGFRAPSHTLKPPAPAPAFLKPAVPIVPPAQDATWGAFNAINEENLHDPKKTAAEAEKDLKELFAESFNGREEGEGEIEIDMADAVVEGFQDNIRLLPHQIIGRKWMAERESGKRFGGILADDMGLGKTIQTITRIVDGRPKRKDKEAGWDAATLVIAPVALVSQWAAEISKMAVGLRVIEHHGPKRTTDPSVLRRSHVVVTSYTIVASEYASFAPDAKDEGKKSKKKSLDSDSDSASDSDDFSRKLAKKSKGGRNVKDALFQVKWFRIVLDEAHNIKNRKTKAAVACCELQGKYRWCLTGTPLQNSVEELYSLIKFLRIKPLNDWPTFNDQIAKPVKSGKSVRAMKRLHVVLRAIMLRRKKTDILNGKALVDLPARTVQIVTCDFDEEERSFYTNLEEKITSAMEKVMQAGDMQKSYTHILVLLLRLRQACNHPSLITGNLKDDSEALEPRAPAQKDESDEEVDELADALGGLGVAAGKKCQMCQTSLNSRNVAEDDDDHCTDCVVLARNARRKSTRGGSNLPPDSAKIRKILELLEQIEAREDEDGEPTGEKTILFSQFTSMLDIIQIFLKAKGIEFVRYDGSMSKDKREISLNKIKTVRSIKVILISFKAGSTGLNLTACNNVILVDLWWNPALEEQAFDRAHRFGQKRDVNIYKLTIEKTVEERILLLQEKKRALASAALAGDKLKNSRLGLDDLMALFRPGHDDEEEA